MSIEDDITDDMVERMAARLGAPGQSGRQGSRGVTYESVCAHRRKWHVMRIEGGKQRHVETVESQEAASALIRKLKAEDEEGRG